MTETHALGVHLRVNGWFVVPCESSPPAKMTSPGARPRPAPPRELVVRYRGCWLVAYAYDRHGERDERLSYRSECHAPGLGQRQRVPESG